VEVNLDRVGVVREVVGIYLIRGWAGPCVGWNMTRKKKQTQDFHSGVAERFN
jgi:hypothetical protein